MLSHCCCEDVLKLLWSVLQLPYFEVDSTYFMPRPFLFCSTAIMLSIWLLNKIMRKFTFSVFSPRLNKMSCTIHQVLNESLRKILNTKVRGSVCQAPQAMTQSPKQPQIQVPGFICSYWQISFSLFLLNVF